MIKTELYFGRNITYTDKSVERITGEQIDKFLSDIVSPLFPGFTVLRGVGYWQGEPEDCFVVVIIHESTNADYEALLEIIRYYKRTFYQESVLRVDSNIGIKYLF